MGVGLLCISRLYPQFPPVGGSVADTPRPLRRGPPRREGPGRSVVSVSRPAAWAPHPGARLPAGLGALIRRYRPLLPSRTRPPYQCFGVPGVLAVSFGFSIRRAPPLFVLSFGLSHPGERLPAVPSVLALPPCPARSVPWRAPYRSRCRRFLPYRAHPPDQCFRSVGFRRPLAVEDSDRRTKQVRAPIRIL